MHNFPLTYPSAPLIFTIVAASEKS